jgi:hypothetical protein
MTWWKKKVAAYPLQQLYSTAARGQTTKKRSRSNTVIAIISAN